MILPLRRETIVSPDSILKIEENLRSSTGSSRADISDDHAKIFIGRVSSENFQITRRLDRPENFMPMIKGRMESTANGSILFLTYTLQFSSRMFVIFWTVTTFLFAVFLWFIQTNISLGLISIGAMLLNIVITHLNFQKQYKNSRKELMQILFKDNNR